MDDVPRSELFDDVYFSADDGPGETYHVFFDGNNLPARWQGRHRFTIGETGFGTGLNFLLAWDLFERTAPKDAFLDFVSVEKFPMSVEAIREGLSPWADRLAPYLEKMLARYPLQVPGFHRIVFDNKVALTLIFGDANDVLPEIVGSIDAWFLDGFTPSKNPDMWTKIVFNEMARLSHPGTSFATFTAAGFVKRGLREAGFTVAKKDGFGRKRDMLAGYFEQPDDATIPQKPDLDVAIAGAGLAGAACAYALSQYGFNPTLYDPNGIASGASGNPLGIINPRFTAFRSAESDFYAAGYALAARTFLDVADIGYARPGSLHLITDEDKKKRFTRTAENWKWDAAHMRIVSREEASRIASVDLQYAALYLPESGQVNPAALCRYYARDIPFLLEKAPALDARVIFANGAGVAEYEGLKDLPIHTVRGQITCVAPNLASQRLQTNLCYGGYISAPTKDGHIVGSTFQKWLETTNCVDEDDRSNLEKLQSTVPSLGDFSVTGHRAALRTASQDRFPVIGEVSGSPGCYVTTAHGSHGIVSSLMGAHLIADFLRGGPFCLGRSTIQALSMERFRIRDARKSFSGTGQG